MAHDITLSIYRNRLGSYGRAYGLDVSVARISKTYGQWLEIAIWVNGDIWRSSDLSSISQGIDWLDRIISEFNPNGY